PPDAKRTFPCVDRMEERTRQLQNDPVAASQVDHRAPVGHHSFIHDRPFLCDYGGWLPQGFRLAYETWGTLNAGQTNAILIHTGLSANSHARSHAANPAPGWWERFIGPGQAIDTDKFFVVCTNVLGSCYGSTGPSSRDPVTTRRYATTFPILTIHDMVRAQFHLLDHLGIYRLHASVGASMGGMQSLAAAVMYPDRVGRLVTISACARSHPYSIALRHVQRQVLMSDPHWRKGHYYHDDDGGIPPHAGMKLAREIATISYRSGPEWGKRFGRKRLDPAAAASTAGGGGKPPTSLAADDHRLPEFCPDFLIESYLDHQGEKFCLQYDPNSLLYISKAMDLFDLSGPALRSLLDHRHRNLAQHVDDGPALRAEEAAAYPGIPRSPLATDPSPPASQASQPPTPTDAAPTRTLLDTSLPSSSPACHLSAHHHRADAEPHGNIDQLEDAYGDELNLIEGLRAIQIPTLVLGVKSDILFPVWQQQEIAQALRRGGNQRVTYYELDSIYGHDTFLLDLTNTGAAVKGHLENLVIV
ncbi:homoserine O-acetyltransferase, partial [Tieghemiomyces parasiticus]